MQRLTHNRDGDCNANSNTYAAANGYAETYPYTPGTPDSAAYIYTEDSAHTVAAPDATKGLQRMIYDLAFSM
jgi:hypothetical protein